MTWIVVLALVLGTGIVSYALRRGQAISFTMKLLGTALHIETRHRDRRSDRPGAVQCMTRLSRE